MAVLKCTECGKEGIVESAAYCPECGSRLKHDLPSKDCMDRPEAKDALLNTTGNGRSSDGAILSLLKSLRVLVCTIAFIGIIISIVFFAKARDVKEHYYNSDYSSKNAYVGGDAYNYIINGTYFTGYSVIGSAGMLGAVILFSNAVMLTVKIKEYN